jgi:hypothetical protein
MTRPIITALALAAAALALHAWMTRDEGDFLETCRRLER